jgi:hypothetical protein
MKLIFLLIILLQFKIFAQNSAPQATPPAPQPAAESMSQPEQVVQATSPLLIWLITEKPQRQENPDIKFPNVTLSITSYLNKKKITANTNQPVLKKAINEFCQEYSVQYKKAASKILNVEDLGNYFESVCQRLNSRMNDENRITQKHLNALDSGLPYRFDLTYIILTQMPFLNNNKIIEDNKKAYNNSLFGLVKIPYEYNYLVTQVFLILLLALGIFKSVKR